ncbi:MAG: hypothetical protein V8Q32_05995 [Anaerotignum faecicola]
MSPDSGVLIITTDSCAGYMMPNENVVSEQLGIGRSTLREALAVFWFIHCRVLVNEIDNIVNIGLSITLKF